MLKRRTHTHSPGMSGDKFRIPYRSGSRKGAGRGFRTSNRTADWLRGTVLVLLLWYLLTAFIRSPIIPWPHRVAVSLLFEMGRAPVYQHIAASFGRIAGGLSAALFFGILIGIPAGGIGSVDRAISPVLYLLYPLPKIAFLPVFMVLFGIGNLSKIMLIAVIVFFPIAVSVRDGTRELIKEHWLTAAAFHLTGSQVARDIILPGLLPRIFSSLRISLGISLSVLFISENFAADRGLGYSIMNHWVMADYIGMYGAIVLLSLLGLGLYAAVDRTEAFMVPWSRIDTVSGIPYRRRFRHRKESIPYAGYFSD